MSTSQRIQFKRGAWPAATFHLFRNVCQKFCVRKKKMCGCAQALYPWLIDTPAKSVLFTVDKLEIDGRQQRPKFGPEKCVPMFEISHNKLKKYRRRHVEFSQFLGLASGMKTYRDSFGVAWPGLVWASG